MPDINGARLVNEPPAQPPAEKPFIILVQEDKGTYLDERDLKEIGWHIEEIVSQLRFFSLVVPMTTVPDLMVIREQIERIAEKVGIETPRWGRP